MIKKLFLFIFILMVFAATAFYLKGEQIIRRVIDNSLEKIIGSSIIIDDVDINRASNSLTVKGFKLYNPPGYPEGVLLDVPEAVIKYDLSRLAQGQLIIPSIIVHVRQLIAVKNQEGKFNVDELKVTQKEIASHPAPKKPSWLPTVQVGMLRLSVGMVVEKDYLKGVSEPVVSAFEVNIKEQVYKDIPTFHDFFLLILKESMKKTAIKGAKIYGISTIAGASFFPAGIAVLLTGKDNATVDLNATFDEVYRSSLGFANKNSRQVKANKNSGMVSASIYGNSVDIKIRGSVSGITSIAVSARKNLFPRQEIAKEILYEILSEIEAEKVIKRRRK